MNKILKKVLILLISLILLILIGVIIYLNYWRSSSTVNTFSKFSEEKETGFTQIRWESDSLGKEKIDKIAFLVPVQIKGLKGNLFMQFDTGISKTVFYGKTLDAILDSETTIETYIDKDSVRYFKNPSISIGTTELKADKIKILSKRGHSTIDTSFINIGSIGFDAVVNRTLILDFKNDKLALTEKKPEALGYSLKYVDNSSVNKFPFLIPAKIGSKKIRFFYDTGSSMFPVLTSHERLSTIDSNKTDTLCCVTNWGRQLPVYRKKLKVPIIFGNNTFDNQYIYSAEMLSKMNYVPAWYVYGMTGNKIFDNKIIVIDNKNNVFGIEE